MRARTIEARNVDGQTMAQHVYTGAGEVERTRETEVFMNAWSNAHSFKHHGAGGDWIVYQQDKVL